MKLLPPWRSLFRKQLPAVARQPFVAIASPSGRPTYDQLGLNHLMGPWFRIPSDQRYELYQRLREGIPVLNRAVQILVDLVGCPCVEAADDTKMEVDAWLEALPVNRTQTGLGPFLQTWIGNMLTYGRGHAEVIPTRRYDDIAALMPLHPATISFRPLPDGYRVEAVQSLGPQPPIQFADWQILNAVHDCRDDNPNGTSLFWGLPFVGDIWMQLLRSEGNKWERFGSPILSVNYEPPDTFNDPNGSEMREIVGELRSEIDAVMTAAANGRRKDFVSGGKVTVGMIGAQGEEMNLEIPARTVLEQIIARTGIPPMLFGVQWATTERMSVVQSSSLAELVDGLQEIIAPPLKALLDLRQRLTGGDTNVDLKWDSANLTDKLQDAQAKKAEEEARKAERENDLADWRNGHLTAIEFARRRRPDLDHLDDAMLLAKLRDMLQEPPEEVLPPQPGASGAGQPGQGAGNNRPPGIQRSLTGNGNGVDG